MPSTLNGKVRHILTVHAHCSNWNSCPFWRRKEENLLQISQGVFFTLNLWRIAVFFMIIIRRFHNELLRRVRLIFFYKFITERYYRYLMNLSFDVFQRISETSYWISSGIILTIHLLIIFGTLLNTPWTVDNLKYCRK